VTNKKDVPHAVLVRAIHPTHGIPTILKRRKMNEMKKNISSGPGTVSEALGIHYRDTGLSLLGNKIWIEDRKYPVDKNKIQVTKRIGVEYAGKDAELLYRFVLKI
jgi:DNA-3-methyladenine glycosylase